MIADGDVAALRADPGIRVGESDPLAWVQAYSGSVIRLPPEAWRAADAIRLEGCPDAWSVMVPLWTDSESPTTRTISAVPVRRATR
jgi:hypothetical protein